MTSNTPFAFMDRISDLNAYTLKAVMSAAAHRESWYGELEQSIMKLSKSHVANELDYGYRAISSVISQQRIPAAVRYRMHGALLSWLEEGLQGVYSDINRMDDFAFYRYILENEELILRIEGAYRALNLFKESNQRQSLLPSDRIRSLQRLQEVNLVHFSHSHSGPYKAALVHKPKMVLCLDFSSSAPLHTIASWKYDESKYDNYMTKSTAINFRSFIYENVPSEHFSSLHHILLELLPIT